ncbi:MAG: hypothetical protein AAF346_25785, partial [Pseudomonadota bacterium]
MPDHDDNDGFLLRWSRRKRGVQEPAKTSAPAVEVSTPPPEEEVVVASLDAREVVGNEVTTDHAAIDQEVVRTDG